MWGGVVSEKAFLFIREVLGELLMVWSRQKGANSGTNQGGGLAAAARPHGGQGRGLQEWYEGLPWKIYMFGESLLSQLQNVLAEDASFSGMFHSGAGPRAPCHTEYFDIFCQTCIFRISLNAVCNLSTLHHSNHKYCYSLVYLMSFWYSIIHISPPHSCFSVTVYPVGKASLSSITSEFPFLWLVPHRRSQLSLLLFISLHLWFLKLDFR